MPRARRVRARSARSRRSGFVALVARLASTVGGPLAGRLASVVAAVLASSIALQAVYTAAELIAAVRASGVRSLASSSHCGRSGMTRTSPGALASSAVLVKQWFLDAGLSGFVSSSQRVSRSRCFVAATWPEADR